MTIVDWDPADCYRRLAISRVKARVEGREPGMPLTRDDAAVYLHAIDRVVAAMRDGGRGEAITGPPPIQVGVVPSRVRPQKTQLKTGCKHE